MPVPEPAAPPPTCSPLRTAPFARSWLCRSPWCQSCRARRRERCAYFLLAFTKIGLMPDGGASALVAVAIGRTRAMRLALLDSNDFREGTKAFQQHRPATFADD
jgi:hypothetical protein